MKWGRRFNWEGGGGLIGAFKYHINLKSISFVSEKRNYSSHKSLFSSHCHEIGTILILYFIFSLVSITTLYILERNKGEDASYKGGDPTMVE